MKDKDSVTLLRNPNDPSHGECYAPVENGTPNVSKKKHINEGDDPPNGWVHVDCSINCP